MNAAFVDPQTGELLAGHAAVQPLERLIARTPPEPAAVLAALSTARVPAAAGARIVAALAPAVAADEVWREALERDRARGERMQRAIASVESALAPLADCVALTASALGPLWGSDVDVLVRRDRLAQAEAALLAAGFVALGPLMARLGSTSSVRRFAVIDGTEALASVELSTRLHDGGPRAEAAIARAAPAAAGALPRLATPDRLTRLAGKAAGERRVPVRALLELAALEAALSDSGAARAAGLPRRPNLAWLLARARNAGRRVERMRPGRRFVVAFSGIDGSGKSTQVAMLGDALDRLGVRTASVWGRIGYTGSPLLSTGARTLRRVLPAGSHSAQRARAGGSGGERPLTRRGPLGWSWALAVTLVYLRSVRGGVRAARGRVVILDRALPDALVDLEKGFGGNLALGVHARLVRWLQPRADATFHVRVPAEVAHARKTELFTTEVLAAYAARFDELAAEVGAIVVDGCRPPQEIADEILRAIIDRGSG